MADVEPLGGDGGAAAGALRLGDARSGPAGTGTGVGTGPGRGTQGLVVAALVTLALVAVGLVFYYMRPVLVPLVLALLVSYLIAPVVDFVQVRLKVPRSLAVLVAFLLAFAGVAAVIMLISSSAASLMNRAPMYQDKIVMLWDRVLGAAASAGLPIEASAIKARLAELPAGEMLGSMLNSLAGTSTTFLLVLVFVIYLVSGRTPHEHRTGIYKEMDASIRRYLTVKVLMSVVTGVAVGGILAVIGLDLAPVFGVLAFLLNFIPSVGSLIATFLPLPLALVQFDTATPVVLVVLIPGVIQVLIGNALEPKLLGSSLNLHPITILLSLVFWGMLWGVAGMVLAAPITAILKIIFDRIEYTRPLGALLAGKLP
jgi:AI-2 transport protein TqsA